MTARRVLLTGATGYVGGRLLAELERRGVALRCLEGGVKVWNPMTWQILPVLTREAPASRIAQAALPRSSVPSLPVFAGGK